MQVLYKSHPSFRSWEMIKRMFLSLLGVVILGGMILFLGGQGVIPGLWTALLLIVIVAGGVGFPLIWRSAHLYIIHDKGVRYETGLLVRSNTRELTFRRIQIVDVHQNIFEKLILKTGDIHIDTAAGDDRHDMIVFAGIRNPARVENIIREGEDAIYSPDQGNFYNPYNEGRHPGARGPSNPPASGQAPWDRSGASAPWDQGASDPYSGEQDYGSRPPMPPS